MTNIFSRFLKDELGATAIEYGLIAAIVGVGIIASLGTLKDALNSKTALNARARSKQVSHWKWINATRDAGCVHFCDCSATPGTAY